MIGVRSRTRKDKAVKVSSGQYVTTGTLLVRGLGSYKPGFNVGGISTLFALCAGNAYFTKKKTPHGKLRTFVNIKPQEKSSRK